MGKSRNIQLKAIDGSPINEFAEYLLNDHHDLVEKFSEFQLIVGKSSFMGAGEKPIKRIEINISYDHLDDEIEKEIDEILAAAKSGLIEVVITEQD